ncbi:MAG: 2Fe-2S iron-sulfur cluster-binding protein [Pseudohaliea sp.]
MIRSVERLACAQVDRSTPVEFSFDGRRYRGYAGDTLASALLANGVAIAGRSFKFHRPRGVFAAGVEEAGAFVQLEEGARGEPNTRATLVPLYDGLRASGQNAWPNVRCDVGSLLDLVRPLLPASFYYKTFKWPSWHFWEPLVRRAAGLGRAPAMADDQRYVKENAHADVVVIGAGRSGLTAALEASTDPQCRVWVVDEQERLGGRLLASQCKDDARWLAEAVAELDRRPNVRLLPRTTVNGCYDHRTLAALERCTNHLGTAAPTDEPRQRFWRLFAGRVVLATGALERPLVFPDNDRPGIMLASAVVEYALRYGVVPGRQLAVYANNDSAWRRALELSARGVPVARIVDLRREVDPALQEAASAAGIVQYLGHAVVAVHGRRAVSAITVQSLTEAGDRLVGPGTRLACDLLAVAGGWSPTVHLYSQAGGKLSWREADACFVPDATDAPMAVVGRAAGDFGEPLNLLPWWRTPGPSAHRQWVDLQYDVTVADIELAVRENYRSVEHLKRYTTAGMSIDQGKTSNVNALGLLAQLTGQPVPAVGTTRFRPPYHPATLGAFGGVEVGALYHPWRELPAHDAHRALGGKLEEYGGWQRPACYLRSGETEDDAVQREVLAVRRAAGLLDYSSLGKIEVRGPDARVFLNRLYVNNLLTLRPGAARYVLLLNEEGIIIDDGVVVCIADDHFLVHATSGGAAMVHEHMEEWLQCEWRDLAVLVSGVTAAWATIMLSGPASRQVLARLPSDLPLDAAAFPHMRFRSGTLCGVPCRVLRASFTGEVSFEISVPASFGQALWESLLAAGADLGLQPFGLEALLVLRLEKGYVHVGTDTDGTSMPQDYGWGRAISKQEADFVGRRSLMLPAGREPGRRQFTGIEPLEPGVALTDGAHVLSADGQRSAGYVTSAHHSPTLSRTVALGLVEAAVERRGETVQVWYQGEQTAARLVAPAFYDPDGERLHG